MFDSMTGYYDYPELKAAVKADPSQKNLEALWNWFERHGMQFWNGESFNCDELGSLREIQEEVSEDEWQTVGYELI